MANQRGVGRRDNYQTPTTQGKNHLLLIGIDQYEKWQTLSNAVKDAREFAQVLITQYQFKKEDVYSLFDKDATEGKIYQAIRDMKRRLKPDDNLIIYYSGHGYFDKEFDEGFWIPVDAIPDKESSFISNANIVKRVNALDTRHTFLIVDSCFSGSLVVQKRNAFADENFKSRRILASGRNETVSDGKKGENSPFAAGLLTMLRKNTQARLDSTTLIRYVKDYVYGKAKQNPVDGRIPNSDDEGGDFVFHLRKDEVVVWKEVSASNTVHEYRNYLAGFPDGKYVDAANKKISLLEEDEVWDTAKINDNESAYENYIQRYTPTGKYLADARICLDNLKNNRQEKQKTRQNQAKTEKERDQLRLQFDGFVTQAESFFTKRKLKEAKEKYRDALDTHLPGFVPTQQYLEEQINLCQTNLTFIRHYEHGKSALETENYRLAIEYFQEALKIRHNSKVENLIQHCQLKLKAKKRDNRPQATKAYSNNSSQKKKSKSPLFWIVLGAGGLFILLAIIGLMADGDDEMVTPEAEYTGQIQDNNQQQIDNTVYDNQNQQTTTPVTAQELILGSWTVNQVLVDGYDLVESYPLLAYLIGSVYEFKSNNIVSEYSIDGNYNYNYSIDDNTIYIQIDGYGTGTIYYVDAYQLSIILPYSIDGFATYSNFTFNMSRNN